LIVLNPGDHLGGRRDSTLSILQHRIIALIHTGQKTGDPMMLDPVIRTDKLTRYFGKRAVVRDLNLKVPRGQVTALLGLNGASKTTTIRTIMGLLRPTRGRCEVLGQDSSDLSTDVRMRIGYMVEGHYLYPGMRVRDCAKFQRAGYSRWNDALFDQIISQRAER